MFGKDLKREGNTVFDVSSPEHPVVFAYRYKGDWYRPESRDSWVVVDGIDRMVLDMVFKEAA